MVTRRLRQNGDERGMITRTLQGCLWVHVFAPLAQVRAGFKINSNIINNVLPGHWGAFLFVTNLINDTLSY
jgi:hypothetical protein